MDHDLFLILKNSGQDLSNDGSNFILSSLEVGHWAAQTQAFFDKLPEITDFSYNNLRIEKDSEYRISSYSFRGMDVILRLL